MAEDRPLFDLHAEAAGFDVKRVQVDGRMASMGSAVRAMLHAQGADGVHGLANTRFASATPYGDDPASLRFLNGSEVLPETYGNTLVVTRQTCQRNKPALQGLLLRQAPGSERAVNLRRPPSVEEVFDRSLLRPLADRVRHLAG